MHPNVPPMPMCFEGRLVFNSIEPDGMPKKLLDISRLHSFGWRARIGLEQGIAKTYKWYVENVYNA